jgi:hypothetical protein
MSSWVRIALMWLLAIALPVQGWAAATMFHCGPSHHRMAAQAAAAHDAAPHHAEGSGPHGIKSHAGQSQPHHGHHPATAADVTGLGDDGFQQAGTDHHGLQKLDKFKCSACASCCLGVGLPSTLHILDASVSSGTVAPGMAPARVVFLTAGLERPPRPLLA